MVIAPVIQVTELGESCIKANQVKVSERCCLNLKNVKAIGHGVA
jgi:hypothetical protein